MKSFVVASCLVILAALAGSVVGQGDVWPRYYLFTVNNKQNPIEVNVGNLLGSGFSKAKKTYILIHGFGDSATATRLLNVKNALLDVSNVNVIVIDWSKGAASPDYFSAMTNQKTTGQRIATFLAETGVQANTVHCIGHSLGAHACGHIGKQIKLLNTANKLARITGIDPAGPFFKGTAATNRLDKTDAVLVDNIHTDNLLGIQDAIGHKDFYPAGGSNQPPCATSKDRGETMRFNFFPPELKAEPVDAVSCSHTRGPYYYAESIRGSCQFTSVPCSGYKKFQNGECKCSSTFGCSSMGHFAHTSAEEGKFYLEISKTEPYCVS